MSRFLALLVLFSSGAVAWSQAVPTATKGTQISAFGEITGGTTDVRTPGYQAPLDKALGGVLGAFYQSNRYWGIEGRVVALKVSAQFPQYSGFGGLRAAKTFNRLTPYVFLGVGLTRGYYPDTGNPGHQANLAVDGAAGVDYSFGRISWRVAEVSGGKIRGTNNVEPKRLSTGLVYHF